MTKRESFPDLEPATRRDFSVLPPAEDELGPPPSTWRSPAQKRSAAYSIVPQRQPLESGVELKEVASVPASRPAPPSPEMTKSWRVRLLLGRLGRVSPAELLGVPEDADWSLINARYRGLVRELSTAAYESGDGAMRRRVAILLGGLAEAYEALAASRLGRASGSSGA